MREFNGEADHVHPLAFRPTKVPVSALVNSLRAFPRAGSAPSTRGG